MRSTRRRGAAVLLVVLAGLVAWRHTDSAPVVHTMAFGTFTGVAVDAQTGRAASVTCAYETATLPLL